MMDIKKKIDQINSLKLNDRLAVWQDLLVMAKEFANLETKDDILGVELVNCINDVRSARFIESDVDMILLDVVFLIASELQGNKEIMKSTLLAMIYYANFYPEKYEKIQLENKIKALEQNY
jgi:hypothetical protein